MKLSNVMMSAKNYGNLAVAYENVIFKNSSSIMKAKNIIVNISTQDIKINSNDKIEVFKN